IKPIAKFMGLDPLVHQCAALVHDTGKRIIHKKYFDPERSLNETEKLYMQRHVLTGWRGIEAYYRRTGSRLLADIGNIQVRHHRHGCRPYPDVLPHPLAPVSASELKDMDMIQCLPLQLMDGYDTQKNPRFAASGPRPETADK